MLELLVKFSSEREPLGEMDLSSYHAWNEWLAQFGTVGTHGEYADACRKARVQPNWN